MKMLEIFVPGQARPAGSHVSYKGRITHANKKTKVWMDAVSWAVLQREGRMCLWTTPVSLELSFFVQRPKAHFKVRRGSVSDDLKATAPIYPAKRPDLDKLCRAVQDALTGVVWKDDSQVVELRAFKDYSTTSIGVHIRAREIGETQ